MFKAGIFNKKKYRAYRFYVVFVLGTLLLIAVCTLPSASGRRVSGHIDGLKSGSIYLLGDNTGELAINETPISNGYFDLELEPGKSENPMFLSIDDKYGFMLFLEQGDIVLKADTLDTLMEPDCPLRSFKTLLPTFEEGETNVLYQTFLRTMDSIYQLPEATYLMGLIAQDCPRVFEKDTILADKLKREIDSIEAHLDRLLNDYRKSFALNNSNSVVAPYVMLNEGMGFSETAYTLHELESIFNSFDISLASNEDYKECSRLLRTMKSLAPDNRAPHFTIRDDKGRNIAIDDYKGRYVLLYFWAYWCGPCIEEFPTLKAMYADYHDYGFEIIGISNDPDQQPWKDALKKHGLPWPQGIVQMGYKNSVSEKYNIEQLPTTFLLDPEGKIILKNPSNKQIKNLLNGFDELAIDLN